jgi:hypothetical protein
LAALYAARQVRIAREQAAKTRQAQLEASRPYVIVTIEPSGASRHLFDLVVKNIGQRPALNASITLDPSPVRASEAQGHELAEARMLSEPVAMIAPGQEMRTFYDSHVERNAHERTTAAESPHHAQEDSEARRFRVGCYPAECVIGSMAS